MTTVKFTNPFKWVYILCSECEWEGWAKSYEHEPPICGCCDGTSIRSVAAPADKPKPD